MMVKAKKENEDAPIRLVHFTTKNTVLVPLSGGRGGWAVVNEDDLALLESVGLSLRWTRDISSGAVSAPASASPNRHVSVSRVLLDAGEGEAVRFLNGDPTDLRRENLLLVDGSGTRRDRDYLSKRPRKWGSDVQHEWARRIAA
jgi:hypothetical protein